MNSTQDMNGGKSFPPRKTSGFGEMGTDIEINTEAPYGNKKFVPGGFTSNEQHAGTSKTSGNDVPECSIRNIRVADLGDSFGHGSLPPLEIAGAKRSLPKKFMPGGQSS